MKRENKVFLDNHRDAYTEILKAQSAKKANGVRNDFVRIMREEFIPGYVISFDCGSCLFDLVKLLYQKYDAWLANQPKEEPNTNKTLIYTTIPKQYPNEQDSSNSDNLPKRKNNRRR
jgi:hypothetical protein